MFANRAYIYDGVEGSLVRFAKVEIVRRSTLSHRAERGHLQLRSDLFQVFVLTRLGRFCVFKMGQTGSAYAILLGRIPLPLILRYACEQAPARDGAELQLYAHLNHATATLSL